MRKVVLDLAVTLDGFIEGPHGEIDWCVMDDDMGFENFLSSIDAIFYGRVSYDMWGDYQPATDATAAEKTLWEAVRSKRKFVFSSKPQAGKNATYILPSDLVQQVTDLKNQEGKDIWLYGGASLIQTFIQAGLIDVYRLSVHPVALGSGKPLFQGLTERVHLNLVQANTFKSGVVQLVYEPKT